MPRVRGIDGYHREGRRELNRRRFLGAGFRGFSAFLGASLLPGCGGRRDRVEGPRDGGGGGDTGGGRPLPPRSNIANLSPLQPPDGNGIMLPPGFTSRVVARSGQPPAPSGYSWHGGPDGGAAFAIAGGGWVYVSNSELPGGSGGVGALMFDRDANVTHACPILSGTNLNCAGGRTPWNTWLSCEEVGNGRVFECDPLGLAPAIERPALGIFKHEAVAVDTFFGHLYLTEDEGDGRLYRFVPASYPYISAGTLQVAEVIGDPEGPVVWHDVPDPGGGTSNPTRYQVPASTPFRGGEGIAYHDGIVCFATKVDNRIWCLDTTTSELTILYDDSWFGDPVLTGVDNVDITSDGDVLVAEDPGNLQIVAITPSGTILPILQMVGHDASELAGMAFDPSHTRLYFSSQRGTSGALSGGITYEITGPFVV